MSALRVAALLTAEAALLCVIGLLALTFGVPVPLALLLGAFASGAALTALADRWAAAYVPGAVLLAAAWASGALLLTLDRAAPSRVLLIGLLLLALWRGTRAARPLLPAERQQRLWRGTLVLLGASALAAAVSTPLGRPLLLGSTALLALVFLSAALLALATPNSGQQRQLPAILLAIGLPLLGSLALLSLLSASLADALGTAWVSLAQLLLAVLGPLAQALFAALNWLRRLLPFAPQTNPVAPLAQNDPLAGLRAANSQASAGGAWISWLIGALAAALPLLALLALVLRRRRQTRPLAATDEEVTSVFSWQQLAADLASLAGTRATATSVAAVGGSAGAVRRLYAALLQRVTAHGVSRSAAETPTELRGRIAPLAAPQTAPLSSLTERFERARYYPASITAADATAAAEEWQLLDQTIQRRSPPTQ